MSAFADPAVQAAREGLVAAGLDPDAVLRLVRATLAEDLGVGPDDELGAHLDLTSAATVPADAWLDVRYVARQPGTVAGLAVLAAMVADVLGPEARFVARVEDGARVAPGDVLAELEAPARGVLLLERTSLNLLGHLCGVATATAAWVAAVEGTGVQVRDTRKTMPLLRALEKHAVRCGGGRNHRAGLHDAVLVKDNHVAAAGGVGAALEAVRAVAALRGVPVQVEVDDLDQLDEALAHGAREVLLDNFSAADLREAVRRTRSRSPGTVLEASGGLTLDVARAVAATGVDLLAVGGLTHSAPSLDIGLDAR
ncbi:nicotinate-nucleotide pyrophosphorylase [carboxylating] [Nocardioides scoriae]|uniref:Nicotinate-nucleotide pyrophosphorylase [carboxylating] n=1 Tax=Nocardioides scoriae TaxID=642780 RepID=A0A1H1U765_9ACTN|nr:carboxylating nicotinate-nucleotide diphosphorylase [Nocardioides scoriae]SDS68106.1 nicotinate-nucleotide pyrophosphorylase [carboxylating] [Nocardioides scoriae]